MLWVWICSRCFLNTRTCGCLIFSCCQVQIYKLFSSVVLVLTPACSTGPCWHSLHSWIMGMVFWCVATAGFICLSCQNIPQLIYEWQETNDRIIYGLFMQHPLTWSDNTFFVCRTQALPLIWTAIFNLDLAQNINTF